MILLLDHSLEAWDQDPPWNDSSAELVEHVRINILVAKCKLALPLDISIIEGERLLSGLGLGQACLFVGGPATLLFLEDALVEGFCRGLWDLAGLECFCTFGFLPELTLKCIIFKFLLSDGLLMLMFQESRWLRHCEIVLAFWRPSVDFAVLWHVKVLLANHFFFELP